MYHKSNTSSVIKEEVLLLVHSEPISRMMFLDLYLHFTSQFVVNEFLKVNFYDQIVRLANQAINFKFLNFDDKKSTLSEIILPRLTIYEEPLTKSE